MRVGAHFNIEVDASDRAVARRVIRLGSEVEALAFAKELLQPNTELFVSCLGDGLDYGNMIIGVDAQGRTDVRAHEHRGFLVNGVSLEQALSILEFWLPMQERMPNF